MPHPSTFSIVAVDPDAGEAGVAVQSKFLAAGAVVSWARGSVGAVATQAFAEVTFGVRGLDLLAEGLEPRAALDRLLADDDKREERQLGIVDMAGRSASFTGSGCFDWAGGETGDGFCCQGNILAGPDVVAGMAEAYRRAVAEGEPLADRLVEALRAGQAAGGDRRGQEAAGLLVVKPGGGYGGTHDRWIDLRVDHHDEPIEQLAKLLDLHRLYFGRPDEEELISVDGGLEAEIRGHLDSLGKLDGDTWRSLEDYMGWENLEERWAGPGRIDPRVLAYLRDHAARGA